MTRADINFIYQDKAGKGYLYWYHNGDQYPAGIRDYYNLLDWLKNKDQFNRAGFEDWLGKNYTEQHTVAYTNKKTGTTLVSNYEPTEIPAKPEKKHFEVVDTFTDYGYTFDAITGTIKVYHWGQVEWEGTREAFTKWLKAVER